MAENGNGKAPPNIAISATGAGSLAAAFVTCLNGLVWFFTPSHVEPSQAVTSAEVAICTALFGWLIHWLTTRPSRP